MNRLKLANYYVTLAVFLMVTVAVVAGQARPGPERKFVVVEPLISEVAERVNAEIIFRLERAPKLDALRGHN